MNTVTPIVAAWAVLLGCLWTVPASATPLLFSQATKQGMPAKGCQYCHVSKMPQKASYKPDDLNDRGKWLMTEKGKQGAKDVKAEWLEQYPGGKEQK
jgi:hypothetical protein